MVSVDEEQRKLIIEAMAAAIFGSPKPRDGAALPFTQQPEMIRQPFYLMAERALAALVEIGQQEQRRG